MRRAGEHSTSLPMLPRTLYVKVNLARPLALPVRRH